MTKKTAATIPGGITEEQLSSWKRKYGQDGVIQIDVTIQQEITEETGSGENKKRVVVQPKITKTGYFMDPFQDISIITTASSKTDKKERYDFMMTACWLGGDPEIKKDPRTYLTTAVELYHSVELYDSEVKKI